MSRLNWLLLGILAVLIPSVGCVTCRHKGHYESLCVQTEFPLPARNQIYLFMMNGYDLLEIAGMLGLRDQLCCEGFSKVYYAQRVDTAWYSYELHRIACQEPGARFVLLGYGGAADQVKLLACQAARDGLPIESVIFLDPVGAGGDLASSLPFHTMVVRSHSWSGGHALNTTETLQVANAGHYSLPTHQATVQQISRIMAGCAKQVPVSAPVHFPVKPLFDKPDPTPRPIDPSTNVIKYDEWDFLKPGLPFPSDN